MKKLIACFLICTVVVVACGKKIVPESEANERSGNGKEKSGQSASKSDEQNNSSSSTPAFNNTAKSVPSPLEGARSASLDIGKTVFVTKCGGCHGLKSPSDYTTDQMNNILRSEIPKANLSKKESDDLTAYLLANTKK